MNDDEEETTISDKEKIGISFDFREDMTVSMSFYHNETTYRKVYPWGTPPAEVMKILRDLLLEAGLKKDDVEIEYAGVERLN
jgi:hypothetical protein